MLSFHQNLFALVGLYLLTNCNPKDKHNVDNHQENVVGASIPTFDTSEFYYKLSAAAVELTHHPVIYDATYFDIPYPNGDVPNGKGVCCDVIIRAYRALGIDLQKLVHEDMKSNFSKYPKLWGLTHTDTNIDHRRVPNLMCFFTRKNAAIPITNNRADYHYGDIVTWDLGNGQTHIGIVTHINHNKHLLIAHNIGSGQILSDCLFQFKIIGHYRFSGN